MNARIVLPLLLALGLLGAIHWALNERPVVHADGVLVDAEPEQSAPHDRVSFKHGAFTLEPLADYTIRARLLSRENYRFDAGAALSPVDFALGWRGMSDSAVLEQLDISQSVRFYTYSWRDQPPLPPRDMARDSANVHLIPADARIARALDRVRVGALVELKGQLVRAVRADGWTRVSSLTREDTGGGACELMFVREVDYRQ